MDSPLPNYFIEYGAQFNVDWNCVRIQFVGQIASAIMSNYEFYAQDIEEECKKSGKSRPEVVAQMSYEMTDALIERLEKGDRTMNYYIQGSPARAEEIKAAFKKLGYDTGNLEFTSSLLYYTIEGKVKLMGPKSLQNLIKTHPDYKELPLRTEPKFKEGQTVVFDGSVLTIHHIIEGYYLFNEEGSRGCRIDQQDKFVELKFKVGDYLKHKACDVTATVESIDVKGMCYRVHGYYPIPIVEQDEWENLDNPKFKVGDLVVFNDLIGRVNEVTWQDHFGFAYKVGNIIDINECALQPADHRDVTRIVKNG